MAINVSTLRAIRLGAKIDELFPTQISLSKNLCVTLALNFIVFLRNVLTRLRRALVLRYHLKRDASATLFHCVTQAKPKPPASCAR